MAILNIPCKKCGKPLGLMCLETPVEWKEGTNLCKNCSEQECGETYSYNSFKGPAITAEEMVITRQDVIDFNAWARELYAKTLDLSKKYPEDVALKLSLESLKAHYEEHWGPLEI